MFKGGSFLKKAIFVIVIAIITIPLFPVIAFDNYNSVDVSGNSQNTSMPYSNHFDWKNNQDIKELRTYNTKDFVHPDNPGKRIKIKSFGLLHYFDGNSYQDIPELKFPEGKLIKNADDLEMIDIPDWGTARLEDDNTAIRIIDKKNTTIYVFHSPFVADKDNMLLKINEDSATRVKFGVSNNKIKFILPEGTRPENIRAYYNYDTSSTNDKDNYLAKWAPNNNAGNAEYFHIQKHTDNRYIARGLFSFTLPAGSGFITRVSLELTSNYNNGSSQIDMYRVIQTNWTELGSCWNKYDSMNNWTSAGGDYDSGSILDSNSPSGTGAFEWVVMGVDATNSYTLDWSDNIHLMLKYSNETAAANLFEGRSKEHGTASERPYLEITYEIEEPVEDYPVIIIPGIMGSQYSLFSNKWVIDPVLHVYDDLIAAFEINDYVEGKNLFTFPYQWRQNNMVTASQLKQKIDDVKNATGADKVDIVAHSMGGLVSRAYIENGNYENDINKLVFLGTPHQGSPEAYLTWEGASGPNSLTDKITRQIFKMEAKLNNYQSLYDYVTQNIASIKQLLPQYPYLVNFADQTLLPYDPEAYPGNYPYNDLLSLLNGDIGMDRINNAGINIMNIIGNTGDKTIGAISVKIDHDQSPLWPHGKYVSDTKTAGDNTVPSISSSLFIPTEIAGASHTGLPSAARKTVINFLTDQLDPIVVDGVKLPEKVLFIGVYSPVDFLVIDPNGNKLGSESESGELNQIDGAYYSGLGSEPEFATIPDPIPGEYKVLLRGTGNGEYNLSANIFADNGIEDKENLIPGIITKGDQEEMKFIYDGNAGNSDLAINKTVDFNSAIKDLAELKNGNNIKHDWIVILLKNRFRHLQDKYDDLVKEKRVLHRLILKRYILGNFALLEKELGFYLKMEWISRSAYDILTNDINSIKTALQ